MVLPPLMEWVRVSSAFAEHRMASYVDSDDTLQAARIVRFFLLQINKLVFHFKSNTIMT